MMLYTYSTLLVLTVSSSCLNVLLPLYLYPGEGASAWTDVFSTIESHQNVQFEVVVNPNSGPGTSSVPTDANIITGVSKLNSYSNVHTVGYVLTGHGSRSNASIIADIDAYASWASYGGADIAVRGIYFDEVSSDTANSTLGYYQSITVYARGKIPSAQIVFNPGYRAPIQYFGYCDTMVEFEDSLVNYQSQGILAQIPERFREKSAVQIYNTPKGTDVGGMISEMAQGGLGAVFFGQDCCYKIWDNDLLESMAGAV
ncbi:hypothetical protein G7Y79_00071g097460 [Physcia stellaris]|nr:hypothetical protein G7Y79_00071g097460 [Physcia stellaris]